MSEKHKAKIRLEENQGVADDAKKPRGTGVYHMIDIFGQAAEFGAADYEEAQRKASNIMTDKGLEYPKDLKLLNEVLI